MSGAVDVGMQPGERTTRTISDRVLGALGIAMVLLALVLLIRGGEADGERVPLVAPPPIELLEPSAGATLAGPLAVVFRLQHELKQDPSGWGVGGMHLHLQLDGLELMPSSADVEALSPGTYRWSVGELEPGRHRIRLFWSDADHQAVDGGGSEPVEILAP